MTFGTQGECVAGVAAGGRDVAGDDVGTLELTALAVNALHRLALPRTGVVTAGTGAMKSNVLGEQLVAFCLIPGRSSYSHVYRIARTPGPRSYLNPGALFPYRRFLLSAVSVPTGAVRIVGRYCQGELGQPSSRLMRVTSAVARVRSGPMALATNSTLERLSPSCVSQVR